MLKTVHNTNSTQQISRNKGITFGSASGERLLGYMERYDYFKKASKDSESFSSEESYSDYNDRSMDQAWDDIQREISNFVEQNRLTLGKFFKRESVDDTDKKAANKALKYANSQGYANALGMIEDGKFVDILTIEAIRGEKY